MHLKNNAGYTLIEMIIVLSITSTIFLFFTHSLMNNFRLIRKYQKSSFSYTKFRILERIGKDYERSTNAGINENGLELDVPFFDEKNRYSFRKVTYRFYENKLLRKENGEKEKLSSIETEGLTLNMDWEVISNGSNLLVEFADSNGIIDSYSLGIIPVKELR